MSNRRRIRPFTALPRHGVVLTWPDPATVPAFSDFGRMLAAPALVRRPPTVAELAFLAEAGYDAVTGPTAITVVETAEGVRFEGLHRVGWPDVCHCGVCARPPRQPS